MSQNPNKPYLITQSLISSWLWSYKIEGGYKEFLDTLKRKKKPPSKAMLNGMHFENVVNAVLDGQRIDEGHKWYKPVRELSDILSGSQKQVKLSRNITVSGVPFVLYGIFDFLKAGVIYDTKFSTKYYVGKYLTSPQHPMYFALCPEAYKFTYLICDGKYVYRETYYPDDTVPIEKTISEFTAFLERQNLTDLYKELWISKY